MIEKVHEHILDELRINARTDTIFVLTAIIINFITLAINSSISHSTGKDIVIMFTFVLLTIVVCIVSEIGLIRGRQASKKLITGLIEMYEDNGVDKYYNRTLLDNYKLRYNLFIIVILVTGILSITVPFIEL
ncbi:hypothetical protein K7I13_08200 [Brucepastera parasyntrophica]|uniref:hypothetical protein n=1 Tax=Brucepastera parasyntrophica TaxID=2880008 RepID=UPI00210D359F|nr:hypothetical protein [Brucepastera parasyntrophica]ULQ58554.1 hypothetical protein K7I13_08200 [Brucepastera parasyntrophica]